MQEFYIIQKFHIFLLKTFEPSINILIKQFSGFKFADGLNPSLTDRSSLIYFNYP